MDKHVSFCQEIADEICETIATTYKGLRELCAENPHWPDKASIYKWVLKHDEFGDQYMRAKAVQCNWLAEYSMEIASDNSRDTYTDEKGKEKCDHEWVQRSRLRVDTIKWYTSKLAPKLYGDKLQLTGDIDSQAELIKKAKEEVEKIKQDANHGRLAETES
jgi:hypothetical protein